MKNNYTLLIFLISIAISTSANAKAPLIEIKIERHLFYPSVVIVPAHTKIRLMVINLDSTPEEFESYELNREKVILGNSKAIIFVGPLEVGEYPFFGEFNMSTALGKLVAE